MNNAKLTNCLAALCAVLLTFLLVSQSKQRSQLDLLRQRNEAFESAIAQQERDARNAVAKFASQATNFVADFESRRKQSDQQATQLMTELVGQVRQQTAVLNRAIGKIIPVELPESLTKKLEELEGRIGEEKRWPQTTNEADTMVAELRDLLRQIPTWAEDDLLPRLNVVRWGTSAIGLILRCENSNKDQAGDLLDEIDTHLVASPDRVPKGLSNRLTATQAKLKGTFDSFRRDKALEDAANLLKTPRDDSFSEKLTEVLERLPELASDPSTKERGEKLEHDIRARELRIETRAFIQRQDNKLGRALRESNPTIRQIAIGKLLDDVISQRQALLENSEADNGLNGELLGLFGRVEGAIKAEGEKQQVERDSKLREYQRWALSQIRGFNSKIQKTEKTEKGYVYNSSDYYQQIKEAMVEFLLPISVGFLDPAVSRLYNEAFEKGWKSLDGTKEKHLQTEVAEQEAVVVKKGID